MKITFEMANSVENPIALEYNQRKFLLITFMKC